MPAPRKSPRTGMFVFGEFELDAERYQLRRRGVALRLENVPLQQLLLLVEKTGKVVSRKQIAKRLWGEGIFVDVEQGINTAIRKIRLVLQDDFEQPRYVQTLVGKGYRFLPPPRGNETNIGVAVTSSQPSEGVTFTAEELGQAILCAADLAATKGLKSGRSLKTSLNAPRVAFATTRRCIGRA
jgi:DNA-binding winged helix-turn-helix (wHTH) protein